MTVLLNHTIHKPENPISNNPVVLIHGLFGDLHNLGVLYVIYNNILILFKLMFAIMVIHFVTTR